MKACGAAGSFHIVFLLETVASNSSITVNRIRKTKEIEQENEGGLAVRNKCIIPINQIGFRLSMGTELNRFFFSAPRFSFELCVFGHIVVFCKNSRFRWKTKTSQNKRISSEKKDAILFVWVSLIDEWIYQ